MSGTVEYVVVLNSGNLYTYCRLDDPLLAQATAVISAEKGFPARVITRRTP